MNLTARKITINDMTSCAMFTVLIAVGAFIKIPIPVCPFTLQFFFTTMAGILLGPKRGAVSVTVYTLLGLAGLPVFAEGGGLWYVMKPTFGYMIGFILGSYLTGYLCERDGWDDMGHTLAASFAGLLVVYAAGMIYYYIIGNFVINSPIGLWPLFLYCFLLAVPGDIALCLLCALTTGKLRRALGSIIR